MDRVDIAAGELANKPVSTEAARDQFRTYLARQGLRATSQRLAIFAAAINAENHFTAEQLLERARAIDDSVSRATVYRTLPLLTGSELLREVDIGTGEKFYHAKRDGAVPVAQVVCLDCDRIFEIAAPFMDWYGATVSAKLDLTPVAQRLQVSAQCNSFRRTGSCPRQG